uniref:XRN2-binding (XTBD) domain-containing protein n=1 Tax=Petromyzon marinus TaxID=7757 RepID=S4RSV9_PETMA
LDSLKLPQESGKEWQARRRFLAQNLERFRGDDLDRLVSLSMVWANHIFLGCRYNSELMKKVTEMAKGIEVDQGPRFNVLEKKARLASVESPTGAGTDGEKATAAPQATYRPRFEPIQFVRSSSVNSTSDLRSQLESQLQEHLQAMVQAQLQVHQSGTGNKAAAENQDSIYRRDCRSIGRVSGMPQPSVHLSAAVSNHNNKKSQEYDRSFASETIGCSSGGRERAGSGSKPAPPGRRPECSNRGQAAVEGPLCHYPSVAIYSSQIDAKVVTLMLKKEGGFRNDLNFSKLLTAATQASRCNPEYTYVEMSRLAPSDLPAGQHLSTQGYACEVRCSHVYLATGFWVGKNGARDRATQRALSLFLQDSVHVQQFVRR